MGSHTRIHALLVPTMFVMQRTHNRQLIGVPGHQRNMFGIMDPRRRRGDGCKFAPQFRGSVWLRIPRLKVTDPTPAVNDDTGFGARRDGCSGLQLKQGWQRQPGQADTGTEQGSSRVIEAKNARTLPSETKENQPR